MSATVTGRLTDGRLTPLASTPFKVRLLVLYDMTALHLAKLSSHTTDGSGNFSIPGLAQGRFQLEYNGDAVKFTVPASTGAFVFTDIIDLKDSVPIEYDDETLDWLDRVDLAGGSVTASTKTAVQQFVTNMKTAGLWTLCQEIGVFCGNNLASALVKLKYTDQPNLVNTNFVEADYTQATGLLGNGSSKRLDTGYNISQRLPDASHMAFYLREDINTAGNRTMIGALGPSATDQFTLISLTGTTDVTARTGQTVGAATAVATKAFYASSRQSLTDLRVYRNGAQQALTATATTLVKPNMTAYLWAYNLSGGAVGGYLNKRGCFYSIGSAMTPEQHANFYSIVQTLQTALGRQV